MIDAVNIDLKSFNDKYYKKVLKGKLVDVLDSLKLFKKNNIWLEVTTLIIEGQNDSNEELDKIASFISNELSKQTPWHISAFHPDYKMLDTPHTKLNTLKRAYDIGKKHNLNYVYYGNASEDMNTKCPNCEFDLIKRSRYDVLENNILDSKCPKCEVVIDGIFN